MNQTTGHPSRHAATLDAGVLDPRSRGRRPRAHRVALTLAGVGVVLSAAWFLRWDWLPGYAGQILQGVSTTAMGFALAVPLGLVQAAGRGPLAWLARGFCTVIRGTPLLLQMWLLYYGLGSLFPHFPEIRQSWLWPYLREAWPYAVLSLTLSFAGYEGEVMRGAFAGVPRGELEAGRAFGMSRWQVLRRIWFLRAFLRALPTLTGETVLRLKATPLVATITVVDVFAVLSRVRQDTFVIYEPLLMLAAIYLCLTAALVALLRRVEALVPTPAA